MRFPRRWIIPALIVVALLLALISQGSIRELLIKPLVHLGWEISVYVDSIPQAIFWSFLLLVVLLVAIRILVGSRRSAKILHSRGTPMRRMGAVESWLEWINQAQQGRYFRGRLAHRLTELAIELIAYRDQRPAKEVRAAIESGSLKASPVILHYLQEGLTTRHWRAFYDPMLMLPLLRSFDEKLLLNTGAIAVIEHLESQFKGGRRP